MVKATVCRIRLHKEGLQVLYFSSNIIQLIKSMGKGWAVMWCELGRKNESRLLLVNLKEGREPFGIPRRR
jgi:hypothetical protein